MTILGTLVVAILGTLLAYGIVDYWRRISPDHKAGLKTLAMSVTVVGASLALLIALLYLEQIIYQEAEPPKWSVLECSLPECPPVQKRAIKRCALEARRYSEMIDGPTRPSRLKWHKRKAFLRDFKECIDAEGLGLRKCSGGADCF